MQSNSPASRQPAPGPYKAGSLTAQFDNGMLRYIRYGRHEVIRSIYFTLRNQDWGTVPYRIEQFQADIHDTHFSIRFVAIHSADAGDVFRWRVAIDGTIGSEVNVALDGEALQPFWRNRAGFCILHPIEECAGKPVSITQPDGRLTPAVFPTLISPETPFPTVRAMEWTLEPGVTARLHTTGDDFETEDQRNWGDSSYKTYCSPQAVPFPVELRAGDTVRQEVRVSLNASQPRSNAADTPDVMITLHDERTHLPRLGTQQAFGRIPLTEAAIAQLRALHLDHYRVELDLSEPNWQGLLLEADGQAQRIGAGLFIALTLGDDSVGQVQAFVDEVRANPVALHELLLIQQGAYATPSERLNDILPLLRAGLPPDARVGAGTQTNYTELNRNRFRPDGLDFVSYGVQPQEHLSDDATLIENIEAQGDTVRSARALYPQQAVYVSPLSLRKRFNPYAKNAAEHFTEQPLSVQADARQTTPFGAAWLLGSLKTLAEAGAEAVTVFRATGDLGMMSADGVVYPAYEVLKQIQAFRGGWVRRTRTSHKLAVSSLLLETETDRCLIVANHSGESQRVTIPDYGISLTLAAYELRCLTAAELKTI